MFHSCLGCVRREMYILAVVSLVIASQTASLIYLKIQHVVKRLAQSPNVQYQYPIQKLMIHAKASDHARTRDSHIVKPCLLCFPGLLEYTMAILTNDADVQNV